MSPTPITKDPRIEKPELMGNQGFTTCSTTQENKLNTKPAKKVTVDMKILFGAVIKKHHGSQLEVELMRLLHTTPTVPDTAREMLTIPWSRRKKYILKKTYSQPCREIKDLQSQSNSCGK